MGGEQPGGETMCDEMKAGKLWSMYGPKGSFLPGLPLFSATCEPHTPWVWCWGAPCERNEAGDVVCKCPLMITTNDKPQGVSLPGDSLCTEDPCSGGARPVVLRLQERVHRCTSSRSRDSGVRGSSSRAKRQVTLSRPEHHPWCGYASVASTFFLSASS